jgi:hypothetical protein
MTIYLTPTIPSRSRAEREIAAAKLAEVDLAKAVFKIKEASRIKEDSIKTKDSVAEAVATVFSNRNSSNPIGVAETIKVIVEDTIKITAVEEATTEEVVAAAATIASIHSEEAVVDSSNNHHNNLNLHGIMAEEAEASNNSNQAGAETTMAEAETIKETTIADAVVAIEINVEAIMVVAMVESDSTEVNR